MPWFITKSRIVYIKLMQIIGLTESKVGKRCVAKSATPITRTVDISTVIANWHTKTIQYALLLSRTYSYRH